MYDKESIQNDLMVVEYPIQELESQIQLPKATPNPVSAEKSEETSSSPSVIDVPTTSIPAKRQRRRTISLSTKKVDEIVSLDAIEEKDSDTESLIDQLSRNIKEDSEDIMDGYLFEQRKKVRILERFDILKKMDQLVGSFEVVVQKLFGEAVKLDGTENNEFEKLKVFKNKEIETILAKELRQVNYQFLDARGRVRYSLLEKKDDNEDCDVVVIENREVKPGPRKYVTKSSIPSKITYLSEQEKDSDLMILQSLIAKSNSSGSKESSKPIRSSYLPASKRACTAANRITNENQPIRNSSSPVSSETSMDINPDVLIEC